MTTPRCGHTCKARPFDVEWAVSGVPIDADRIGPKGASTIVRRPGPTRGPGRGRFWLGVTVALATLGAVLTAMEVG
jgi:hypothetical protein